MRKEEMGRKKKERQATTIVELLPPGVRRKERTAEQIAAAGPSFDYSVNEVGTVGNAPITVYYDPDLGAPGLDLAEQMLNINNLLASPWLDMQTFFGIAGGAVNVLIVPLSGSHDGSGGAYHRGCDFATGGDLYLDATFANTTFNPLLLETALYVAELSECFMGPQGGGWGCGFSNGEGLSRFCAEQETPPGTLEAFSYGPTGPAWASAGFPDWVTVTATNDHTAAATGCAIVYIYWLRSLGFTIPQIVQAGGTTLSANYQALTGKTSAYQDLLAAVRGLVPSDHPFPPARAYLKVDFNGDGNTDVVIFHSSDGYVSKWYSDGTVRPDFNFQTSFYLGGSLRALPGAQLLVGDFNGDGNMDILVFRSSDGYLAKGYSDGTVGPSFNFQTPIYLGGSPGAFPGAQLLTGDFNGDGNTDILVFRSIDGYVAKGYSDGTVGPGFNFQTPIYLGGSPGAVSGARLIVGDFNGDGKADVLVFRATDGYAAKGYSDASVGPNFNFQSPIYIGGPPFSLPGALAISGVRRP